MSQGSRIEYSESILALIGVVRGETFAGIQSGLVLKLFLVCLQKTGAFLCQLLPNLINVPELFGFEEEPAAGV